MELVVATTMTTQVPLVSQEELETLAWVVITQATATTTPVTMATTLRALLALAESLTIREPVEVLTILALAEVWTIHDLMLVPPEPRNLA